MNNGKIIELSYDDYLFLTEDLEFTDKAFVNKGIKYLIYKKKQRMIDTVRSVMNNELTEMERNIAEDYWCNNLLATEIAKKYKLSRSGLYRTVDVIKEKLNTHLKYVVFYNGVEERPAVEKLRLTDKNVSFIGKTGKTLRIDTDQYSIIKFFKR